VDDLPLPLRLDLFLPLRNLVLPSLPRTLLLRLLAFKDSISIHPLRLKLFKWTLTLPRPMETRMVTLLVEEEHRLDRHLLVVLNPTFLEQSSKSFSFIYRFSNSLTKSHSHRHLHPSLLTPSCSFCTAFPSLLRSTSLLQRKYRLIFLLFSSWRRGNAETQRVNSSSLSSPLLSRRLY